MALFPRYTESPLLTYTLTVLLIGLSSLILTAASPAGPSSLRATVREYLENGGHAKLQKAFNLSNNVYYDPTIFFTRDDAYIRRDGKIIPHPMTPHRHSDLELIRAMGLHVPGVDSEESLRMSSTASSQCDDNDASKSRVYGSKSTFDITYSLNTPDEIKPPVEFAVAKWTEEFESENVVIRVCFIWGALESTEDKQTLGTTNTPNFVFGQSHDKLQSDAVYNPALASALQGEDLVPENQYHVHMLLNNRIAWHVDFTTLAPEKKYDLSTTVLHELTHGLFFSGTIEAPNGRQASYMSSQPGRFDSFMNVEDDIGVVKGCTDGVQLYNAVTSPYLRFYDDFVGARFGLFAPWPFSGGSSVYHFNNTESLKKECEELQIAAQDCSDLMTHELLDEYTQRSLGEPTLRVYRAIRSNGGGPEAGRVCDLPDNSDRVRPTEGMAVDFTLPLWAIITVAVLGGTGVFLVFGVVVSSITGGGGGGSGGKK